MKITHTALLGAFALLAVPALSGCETETATYEDGDTITTPGIDDDVEAGVEAFGDSVASGAEQTGESIEAGVENAGEAIGAGVENTGEAIEATGEDMQDN